MILRIFSFTFLLLLTTISVVGQSNPTFESKAETFSAINQTTGYVSNLNTFVNYIGLEEAKYIGDVDLDNKYAFENNDAVTYDFNGDGYLDLFFFGTDTKTGRDGYHGNGKYFFISDYYNQPKPYQYIQYDSMIEFLAGGIDLQDIDGDGVVEILLFNTNIHQIQYVYSTQTEPVELGVVVLHVNESFEITAEYEVGLPKSVHKGTSGDVDNDGDIDIINFPIGRAETPDDNLYKFPTTIYNDGVGNFVEEFTITDDSIYGMYHQVDATVSNLFDLDGDGYLDLIFSRDIGNFYNEYEEYYDIYWGIYILWGDGTGNFSFDNGINLQTNNELNITMTTLGNAFSDFDNDGDVDLIVTSTVEYIDYILTLFENTGDRNFIDVTEDKIKGYYMFNEEHMHVIDGEIMSIDKNQDGLYDLVPKGVTVGCCTMGDDPQFVDNLWWENVGGKYVRRVDHSVSKITLSLPSNESTGVTLTPTLSWTKDTNSESYTLQVSTDGFESFVVNESLTETSFPTSELEYNTEYSWRVRGTNSSGDGDWSSVWTFTTQYRQLSPSTPLNPQDEQDNVGTLTDFNWSEVDSVESYHLQVSTESSFSTLSFESTELDSTSYTLTEPLEQNTQYYWRVRSLGEVEQQHSEWSDVLSFTTGVRTSVEEVVPTEYALNQNFPNPFNPTTTITYSLPQSGMVTLNVYDITGRFITTLVNGVKRVGTHTVQFEGSSLSSGMYVYTLETDGFRQTRQMMLVK
jgi:hypothetical protein